MYIVRRTGPTQRQCYTNQTTIDIHNVVNTHSSAVLSKKTVTAIFAKNEIRAFYGSLCYYLTMCKARKPYLHSKYK